MAEAGLCEAITFSGSLPPNQVQARLLEAQAILLMSDFEGLPIALLEAMAARSLVAQRYSTYGSYQQWRQLLEGLDQQSADNLPSLYPIHSRRIFSLRRIDRKLHRQYRTPSSRITTLRQTLRTTIARVKHRIKTALGRPA